MINGLGERLHKLRESRRLSRKEVASAIGLSVSVLSNYENGERTPSVDALISLADFYRCSTDYLLGIGSSMPVKTVDVSMLNDEQVQMLQQFLESIR